MVAQSDDTCRLLVLQGANGAFISGADLQLVRRLTHEKAGRDFHERGIHLGANVLVGAG